MQPISAIENLRRFSTCTISNAIETLKVRLRHEGFTDKTIRNYSNPGTMVARAVTVKIQCSSPPTGNDYLEHTDWWDYVMSVPAPRLIVIQDVDRLPGAGSLVGEIHASILRVLDCVGVMTNGCIRDLPALEGLKFHAYATGLVVSHAYAHIVEMGGPVEITGLQIESGDMLHGDVHGVIKIPPGTEGEVASAAERVLEREKEILRLCDPQNFSVDALRTTIRALRASAP